MPTTSRCRARPRAAFALFAVLAVSPGAAAEEAQLLPGLASATGLLGTRFVSTVWIANRGAARLEISLVLVTPTGESAPATRSVEAGATLRLDDPVASVFGLSETAGTLRARASGPFLLRGVTANVADPRGTYGLALPSLREDEALLPGETGHPAWLSQSPAPPPGSRTNVAVTLLSPGSEALVTLLDDSGLVRAETTVTSASPVFWQRSVADLSPDPDVPLGRVEVRVTRGAAVAYTATVDGGTGDGILALARRLEPARSGAGFDRLLAGAARTSGANGTRWRTDLRLAAPGAAPVSVTIASGAAPGLSVSLPPNATVELPDVLGALGLPDGTAGPVRFSASAPFLVLAATGTPDPFGGPGRFSGVQETVRPDSLGLPGAPRLLYGLTDRDGTTSFRANVALAAASGGAEGTLLLRAPAGSLLATTAFSVGPSGWQQRSIRSWFPDAVVPDDASVEVDLSSGAVEPYASVIDNGTGDAVVLAAAPIPLSGCPGSAPAVLAASSARVAAGTPVTLSLAGGTPGGALVSHGLPLDPGGSVTLTPPVTTTYRWEPPASCPLPPPAPVTVEVVSGTGAVSTESGSVRGVPAAGSTAFLGIPFAAPPTGALRFRPPAPVSAWTGVREARSYGSPCLQLEGDAAYGAEDCLFLNVFAPDPLPAAPLPVLFFVHGGGNVQGEGSLPVYDGRTFASRGRGVVVTVNYRLGAFGWLAQPFLGAENRRGVSGNFGAFDLLAALRWVRRNVAAFGGDPGRVLVFGESAGGVNTCTLVASPLSAGLLHAALVESGGCYQPPLADVERFGDEITARSGCGASADPAACLRAAPAETVLRAVPGVASVLGGSGQLYGPAVDGLLLRESPIDALRSGRARRIPFVVGANADETGAAAPAIATEAAYRTLVLSQYGPVLGTLILERYPASAYATPRKAYVALTTDARFVCPSRRYARAAAAGGGPVFRYLFTHPANPLFGAVHAVELPFVFGTLDAIPGFTPSAAQRSLSDAMNASWARLAGAGDPNGPGLTAWPPYDPARDTTLAWDTQPAAVNGVRTAVCDFWDLLGPL